MLKYSALNVEIFLPCLPIISEFVCQLRGLLHIKHRQTYYYPKGSQFQSHFQQFRVSRSFSLSLSVIPSSMSILSLSLSLFLSVLSLSTFIQVPSSFLLTYICTVKWWMISLQHSFFLPLFFLSPLYLCPAQVLWRKLNHFYPALHDFLSHSLFSQTFLWIFLHF